MSSSTPPPLPDSDSAFRTYLRAAALLLPTMFFWHFASTFLVPKLEQLWIDTELSGSRVQWLMGTSDILRQYFFVIVAGVVGLLLLLESRWATWPRYRRAVVVGVTLFFHTAVLLGITTIATAALLAAPLLLKHR